MSLKLGPVAADTKIDPTDPDDVGGISGPTGAGYDAMKIIEANSKAQEALRPFTALARDFDRSDALDLDEISEKAGDAKVEGASVRGLTDENRVVVYLVSTKSGRTARGVMPYADLGRSQRAYEQKQSQKLDAARAARVKGGSEEEYGEDPRVAVLTKRLDELEKEKREAEKTAAAPQPPYEGFSEDNVSEVRERIEGVEDVIEREILKRQIRSAEESEEKPRKGVLDATEPVALTVAEAPSGGASE